ncbi:MAG: hypothetical protein ACTSVL_04170 [Promethearchaeota archaeon]
MIRFDFCPDECNIPNNSELDELNNSISSIISNESNKLGYSINSISKLQIFYSNNFVYKDYSEGSQNSTLDMTPFKRYNFQVIIVPVQICEDLGNSSIYSYNIDYFSDAKSNNLTSMYVQDLEINASIFDQVSFIEDKEIIKNKFPVLEYSKNQYSELSVLIVNQELFHSFSTPEMFICIDFADDVLFTKSSQSISGYFQDIEQNLFEKLKVMPNLSNYHFEIINIAQNVMIQINEYFIFTNRIFFISIPLVIGILMWGLLIKYKKSNYDFTKTINIIEKHSQDFRRNLKPHNLNLIFELILSSILVLLLEVIFNTLLPKIIIWLNNSTNESALRHLKYFNSSDIIISMFVALFLIIRFYKIDLKLYRKFIEKNVDAISIKTHFSKEESNKKKQYKLVLRKIWIVTVILIILYFIPTILLQIETQLSQIINQNPNLIFLYNFMQKFDYTNYRMTQFTSSSVYFGKFFLLFLIVLFPVILSLFGLDFLLKKRKYKKPFAFIWATFQNKQKNRKRLVYILILTFGLANLLGSLYQSIYQYQIHENYFINGSDYKIAGIPLTYDELEFNSTITNVIHNNQFNFICNDSELSSINSPSVIGLKMYNIILLNQIINTQSFNIKILGISETQEKIFNSIMYRKENSFSDPKLITKVNNSTGLLYKNSIASLYPYSTENLTISLPNGSENINITGLDVSCKNTFDDIPSIDSRIISAKTIFLVISWEYLTKIFNENFLKENVQINYFFRFTNSNQEIPDDQYLINSIEIQDASNSIETSVMKNISYISQKQYTDVAKINKFTSDLFSNQKLTLLLSQIFLLLCGFFCFFIFENLKKQDQKCFEEVVLIQGISQRKLNKIFVLDAIFRFVCMFGGFLILQQIGVPLIQSEMMENAPFLRFKRKFNYFILLYLGLFGLLLFIEFKIFIKRVQNNYRVDKK